MEEIGQNATKGDLVIKFLVDRSKNDVPYYGMLVTLDGEVILDCSPNAKKKKDYLDIICFIKLLKNLGYTVSIKEYD